MRIQFSVSQNVVISVAVKVDGVEQKLYGRDSLKGMD